MDDEVVVEPSSVVVDVVAGSSVDEVVVEPSSVVVDVVDDVVVVISSERVMSDITS